MPPSVSKITPDTIQIHENLKLILNVLGKDIQKWVWPLWSQSPKLAISQK